MNTPEHIRDFRNPFVTVLIYFCWYTIDGILEILNYFRHKNITVVITRAQYLSYYLRIDMYK